MVLSPPSTPWTVSRLGYISTQFAHSSVLLRTNGVAGLLPVLIGKKLLTTSLGWLGILQYSAWRRDRQHRTSSRTCLMSLQRKSENPCNYQNWWQSVRLSWTLVSCAIKYTNMMLTVTGNDTTQISLTNTMFELASHPVEQKKLYEELTKSIGNVSTPVRSYSELSQIPYLRACIDETFRILPPVRFGLLRQTVDGGAMIAGHHIPGGVTVSSSVYTLHRYPSLFHSPLQWKPERWLQDSEVSEAERKNLQDFVLPFTLGGRACIGRNLAYMEVSIPMIETLLRPCVAASLWCLVIPYWRNFQLSICLAAMVRSFEFSITHEAEGDFQHFERLNSSPVSLLVSAKARPEVADKI